MKSLLTILLMATVFVACKNQPAAPPPANADASGILKHKYWVSKQFNDALFAPNVVDTLCNLPCSELVFFAKDSLFITACLSDAGLGVYKSISPNTLEIMFEGFEGKPSNASFDEKTGVLHITAPTGPDTGWPTDFVPQDDINVENLDNLTIALTRKRLAGNYSILAQKGGMAITSIVELHADGTQLGFGDFDTWEPWPTGVGSGMVQGGPKNLMYLVKKGNETDAGAAAWQVRGDTLRIWETKNVATGDDMPEYKITRLMGTYLKQH